MGDTIEDMDIEKEQEHKKIEFLESKRGLPDFEAIEEMNKLQLNIYHPDEKKIGLWID